VIRRTLIILVVLAAGVAVHVSCAGKTGSGGRRVIVLGFDGLDYQLTKDLIAEGRLPHLASLAQTGSFTPLESSIPPQSPVAWSTFITGTDPGQHGIFDFIHRHPHEQCKPFFSAAETLPGEGGWEIGEHKLRVDHFDIANRVDRTADVVNVAVFKTSNDLHDRVNFADMTEELIAESLARARAFDQPGDVHKFDGRRNNLLRVRQLGQFCESRIRYRDDAEVGINCAKGIICCLRLAGACHRIEERGFPDVRQADDSSA
jgi:hypothetical protein